VQLKVACARKGTEMKLIFLCVSILAFFFSAFIPGVTSAGEIEDFAKFDRAFIPPLAITQLEQVNPARKAMNLLIPAWRQLKERFASKTAEDETWRNDFETIEKHINKARDIVDDGKNLMAAHEILESVRMILADLRSRNNIAYFPDRLTEFHEHMENIYHSGADATAEEFDEDDKFSLDMSHKEAVEVWQKVLDTPFNSADYGFSEEQGRMANKLIKEETAALAQLETALAGKDNGRIIDAAKAIKPKYAALYKMFGDFNKVMAK
jgi:hypothetical protein